MKYELGGHEIISWIKSKNVQLFEKQHVFDEDKQSKSIKKCIIKRKLKFQVYKGCLETAQIERKINYLREKETDVESLQEDENDLSKIIN